MRLASVFLIAVGLSMDALAVSVANGMILKKVSLLHALKIGFFFGFFQFFMPLIGYFGARSFSSYFIAFDHWIALGLLALIGGKMFFESFQPDDKKTFNDLNFRNIILLSVATSIDALAVGVTFAVTDVNIFTSTVIIGLVTFTVCTLGTLAGKKLGNSFKSYPERIGGVILVLIGIMIVLEHTSS